MSPEHRDLRRDPRRRAAQPRPRPASAATGRRASASAPRRVPARTSAGRPRPTRPPAPPRAPRGRARLRLAEPSRRVRAVAVLIAFVLSLFAGRLIQLQGIDATAYAQTAADERQRTVVLNATRGDITDANGVVLATTVDAVNVTADQTQVTDPAAEAARIAPLVGVPEAVVQARLTGDRQFAYVAQDVSPATWRRIAALRLPGIYNEPTTQRLYPERAIGSNVVGFVGSDGHGLGGLEMSLDSTLAGRDGHLTYQAAAGGEEIPSAASSENAAVPGQDVRLTLNRDIQYVAQATIKAKVEQAGALSGTVVVEDPRTGHILALATYPSFDPNHPGDSPVGDRGNRALTDIYEPGSTSKVMTMAAALDAGVVKPRTHVVVPPSLPFGGYVFHDSEPHGTMHLTATGVLARSSNMGMIKIAERLGERRLYATLKRFGIAEPTGLDFPGESDGMLRPVSSWRPANFATIAFGQGLALNAVQATSVFAAIANGGLRVEPSLVAGTTSSGGTFTPAPAPATVRVVSRASAHTLAAMMESVVSSEGTAPEAEIPGYRVAGKTGTAYRIDPSCGCYRGYTASFIGFAPADRPALVVSVTLQRPVNGHYGGLLGGPVFKKVMSFALQTLKVPPTGTTPPRLPVMW